MNKYTYETDDETKMKLIVNIDKVKTALEKFKACYNRIYDEKDYRNNKKYYFKGKIYTEEELKNEEIKTEEDGLFGCMPIFTEEEVLSKMDECLCEVWDLIE